MMGRISQHQGQLFYAFNLEAVVPDDHLVRAVARVLDLSWVRAELAPHYSHTGRPSIDPVLMIRMLIVGYVFAIRSERALCREVQLNLAYRWFCGLGIEDDIPDHSAFSRARNARFRDSDIFRHVFEQVVGTCIAAGLVGGEGFAVDASLIQADANKHRSIPGAEWNKDIDPAQAHRAVKEYLATLDDPAYGAASSVTPKFVSPSDPAAQWTSALRNAAFFAYADNYLIDVKFGIIMDVEASRAIRQAEVGASQTMIERTEASFGIKPEWLAADTAYGSAANLDWLVYHQGIAPHVPVIDKSQRDDGTFNREDFTFDKERNVYICPAGKSLTTTGRLVNDGETTLLYFASVLDCRICPLRARCCPGRLLGGSRAVSTRRPGTLLVGWPRQRHSSNHAAIARRSRCCSHTSSAFCGLVDCAFAVPRRAVRVHAGGDCTEPSQAGNAGRTASANRTNRVCCMSPA